MKTPLLSKKMARRLDAAKTLGKSLELLALILGAAAGALLMLIRGPLVRFSGREGEAAALLEMMVPICAAADGSKTSPEAKRRPETAVGDNKFQLPIRTFSATLSNFDNIFFIYLTRIQSFTENWSDDLI